MNHEYSSAERNRTYSWILLNLVKAFNWDVMITIIILSPLNVEFRPRTHSVALLWHLEAKSKFYLSFYFLPQTPSSRKLLLKRTPKLSNTSFALLVFSCRICIHCCLRTHYKDLFVIISNYYITQNLSKLGHTITHYSIVSMNLDGSQFKVNVCYFTWQL